MTFYNNNIALHWHKSFNSSYFHFYFLLSFPSDEEERNKWVQALRREKWKPTKTSIICSKHFKDDDFDRSSPFRVDLKKGAIPSVFEFPDHLRQKIVKVHINFHAFPHFKIGI